MLRQQAASALAATGLLLRQALPAAAAAPFSSSAAAAARYNVTGRSVGMDDELGFSPAARKVGVRAGSRALL